MTQMLDILADYLTLRGIEHYRLDGTIAFSERQEQVPCAHGRRRPCLPPVQAP